MNEVSTILGTLDPSSHIAMIYLKNPRNLGHTLFPLSADIIYGWPLTENHSDGQP